MPRVLVIGGSGFVGTRVLRSALSNGLKVASLSRSGAPIQADASLSAVEWLKGDALSDGAPIRDAMRGCDAVISCLGAFGSNDFMHKINGAANASLAEAAAAEGVSKFVFVSAAAIKPVAKVMAAAGYEGYYAGKVTAEEAVTRHFGERGLILRPGPIYGTRAVTSSVSIPIGAVGVPLTTIFETPPIRLLAAALPLTLGDLFMPWVSVEDVADAAIAHIVHKSGGSGSGSAKGTSGKPSLLEWEGLRAAASQLRMSAAPEGSACAADGSACELKSKA